MKLILSFLLLNLNLLILSSATDVIYDSAGNKLLSGVPYYVLPLLRGTGGGLTLSRTSRESCPLDVTQEPYELSNGVPFTITPTVFDETFVHESYPVTIEADVADPCRGSKIWKVATATSGSDAKNAPAAPAAVTQSTVTIGGVVNTPESCFQLVEDDMMPGLQSYQIQYCPFKCAMNSSTSRTCYNIGVTIDDSGKGVVGPTDAMYPVVFANSYRTPTQSLKL